MPPSFTYAPVHISGSAKSEKVHDKRDEQHTKTASTFCCVGGETEGCTHFVHSRSRATIGPLHPYIVGMEHAGFSPTRQLDLLN